MQRMTTFVGRHPLFAYVALTFAISWGGALVAIGDAGGMLGTTPTSDPRFAYALVAMLLGPSLTGVVLTTAVAGRAGLRDYASRLRAFGVGVRWYAVAIATAPILIAVTLRALSMASPAFRPGFLTSETPAFLLVVSLAVGVSAGLFEELGWTGFATPTLRRRYGVVTTGLILGVVWSAWHLLPNIWAARAAAGDLAMPVYLAGTVVGVFVGYLTAFRVLMVWVYDHTRSLFLGMLMHASFTASLLAFNPVGIAGVNLEIFSFALAAVVWLAVAGLVIAGPGRRRAVAARPAEASAAR